MPPTIRIKVGVLAFHGAFIEHKRSLEHAFTNISEQWREDGKVVDCVMEACLVKRQEDIRDLDGMIIPGGESTVMSKFMGHPGFMATLNNWIQGK